MEEWSGCAHCMQALAFSVEALPNGGAVGVPSVWKPCPVEGWSGCAHCMQALALSVEALPNGGVEWVCTLHAGTSLQCGGPAQWRCSGCALSVEALPSGCAMHAVWKPCSVGVHMQHLYGFHGVGGGQC
jgi:hypothetical protein